MKEKLDKNHIVSEEKIDGLFYIMKGIEMLYDLDIDERNKNRDNLEAIKRKQSDDMNAIVLSTQATFVKPLADIYACIATISREILGIEEDD